MGKTRIEVEFDAELSELLTKYASIAQISTAEAARRLIDRAMKDLKFAERVRAAEAIGRMEIEDVPDPEELSRQLDRRYALHDLH